MTLLVIFNKPYGVLSQFSRKDEAKVLADYVTLKHVYPAGRLDKDSEGLLLLTDNGRLQHCISHPHHKINKTYWVQVEGLPTEDALRKLQTGVRLKDGMTAPATARIIPEPGIWPRDPPIRYRATIPTSWLELTIHEGRNRQVRRMTAAVGFPTLRLIRYAVGNWTLTGLAPGEWRKLDVNLNEVCHESKSRQPQNPSYRSRRHRKGRTLPHRRGNR